MQHELQALNEKRIRDQRKYIPTDPGRWGSRNHFPKIPVRWTDINQARVIVETGLESFVVEDSQSSHFFHNLVVMNAGYFIVPYSSEEDFID